MEKLSRTQKIEDSQNTTPESPQPMGTGSFNNANLPPYPQPGVPVNQAPVYPQNYQETQPANPYAMPQQPYPQAVTPLNENPTLNQTINQNVANPLSAYEQPLSPYGPQPLPQQPVAAPLPNDVYAGQQAMSLPLPNDPYANQALNQPPLPPQPQNFNTTIPAYGAPGTSSFGHTDSIPINPQVQQSEMFGEKTDDFFDNLLKEAKQYSINQGLRTEEDTQSNVINTMVAGGVVPPAINQPQAQPYAQAVPQQPLPPQPEAQQYYQQPYPQPVAQPQPVPQAIPQPMPQPQPVLQAQPVPQSQPIPAAPPVSNVNPNPMSTNQADLNFENTVRLEAQQIYQSQPSIEDQLRSIDGESAETLASKAYRDSSEAPVSVIPEVVPIDSNRVVFETGKIKTLENGEITTSVEGNEAPLDQVLQQKMAAETQQLQMRINEYEDELEDAGATVSYTNRVLNIILIFLILGLTVVLAFVVWWILTVRGII